MMNIKNDRHATFKTEMEAGYMPYTSISYNFKLP